MNTPEALEDKNRVNEQADNAKLMRKRKMEQREKSKNLAADLRAGIVKTHRLLEDDDDFRQMRSVYTKQFFETWNLGFSCYIAGDWKKARTHFELTLVGKN